MPFVVGCGQGMVATLPDAASVAISPASASVAVGKSLPFVAKVSGLTDTGLSWAVNGVAGGTAAVGLISTAGLFSAPTLVPATAITVSATSVMDASVRGTVRVNLVGASSTSAGPGIYGPAVQADVLDNQQVATGDVDYRFRATTSGPVTSFTWFDIYVRGGSTRACAGAACECDGYGCGNGGTIDVCLYPDDGSAEHLPTDPLTKIEAALQQAPLGCVRLLNPRQGPVLRVDTFADAPVLTKGTLYHLHWHNTDPAADRNYISVDDICAWHTESPRQPATGDTDLAVLSMYRNGAKVVTTLVGTDTPIFQLDYADGATQGQGYIDSWTGAPAEVSGRAEVREQFTVSGASRLVSEVSVRINRVTGGAPLHLVLTGGNGKVIEEGDIEATKFPAGPALTNDATASQYVTPVWATYRFGSPHLLAAGEAFQLVLRADGGTRYQTYGVEKGMGYPFSTLSYFGDGFAQLSTDGAQSWSGMTQPNGSAEGARDRSNADLQFYFRTL